MSKLEDTNAKTRNQSDRDSPKARIYESFTSPNYIFQNNMCNFAVKTRIINMSIIMKRNIDLLIILYNTARKNEFVSYTL
ncbi:MAG: hypothetical protein EGS41_06855 [Prevotella sp.]|nr:hypothetical protein [Prevotella sp.]